MLQFIKQSFNQAELFLIYVSFFNNQLLQDTKLLTLYNIFMFLSTIKKLLYPCTIVPNIPLTISSSISQYACIYPDKAIATYSIGLLSNNLCSFASDCSVVLRAASTSSHFIRNIFPSVNHTST